MDNGIPPFGNFPPLVDRLVRQLREDGLRVTAADGSAETAGYELGILLQASSTNHSQNKRMLSLWLSPSMRQRFRESSELSLLQAQFDAVGIPTIEADPGDYLRDLQLPPAAEACDEALRQAVLAYLENQDIVRLWALRQGWSSWHLVRLRDPASGQAFLAAPRCAAIAHAV